MPRLDLVDRLGLFFVENFQNGIAHIKDQALALPVIPDLSRFYSESEAIEFHLVSYLLVSNGLTLIRFQFKIHAYSIPV